MKALFASTRRFGLIIAATFCLTCLHAVADESETEIVQRMAIDEDGHIVDFQRDIAPVLRARCLECHNEDEAKNDFRIDDPDVVADYLEPEDAESSSLFIDYLATDDDDMLMPPRSHGGPLTPSELALVRLWINEGATWPEGAMLDGSGKPLPEIEMQSPPPGMIGRVWAFQGYLHPATVHFPIALFLFGAFFVVLGVKWPSIGTQIPLACLLLGAATAIAATLMGWSFSMEKGYGSWTKVDLDAEIFWHRWSAVIVSVLAVIFAAIALVSLRKDNAGLTRVWKIGLLVIAGIVGAVGHQGGELTYGKDFYPKAFRILLGTPESQTSVETEVTDESLPSDNATGL